MIKIYSELDRKDRKGFGRRRMRKDLAGCYFNVHTHLLFLSSPFFIFVTVTFLLLIYVHHHLFFVCFLMQSAPSTNTCCAHCGSYSEYIPAYHKETMHEKFSSVLPGNVSLPHSLPPIYIFLMPCFFGPSFSCVHLLFFCFDFFVITDHRWHF